MKDLFDELADKLKPTFDAFNNLHAQLKSDILRRIITDLMNARTMAEIDEIEARDGEWIAMWPELMPYVQSARKRIRNVILAYKDIHGLEMLN